MNAKPFPPGRGAQSNPQNRFESLRLEPDPEADPALEPSPATRFFIDQTRSIINYNDSPDIGFNASINPYRGCEHGCVYCYARPTHEYLGFSAGLDFESRILVKQNAPQLLRAELASPKWKPQVIALSGVTDCYQPAERKLELTRRCLQVLAEFRNPVGIVTKNFLVTRDTDLLAQLASVHAAAVLISITSLDKELATRLEPRASLPRLRLEAVAKLRQAGIPTGVMIAPVIPALNDHEIPALLEAAAQAGAQYAGYVPLRLPHGLPALFEQWLARHFPERKQKILNQVRSLRGGKLNDPDFGSRMRGEGPLAQRLQTLFSVSRARAGLSDSIPELSSAAFRRPGTPQLLLFG